LFVFLSAISFMINLILGLTLTEWKWEVLAAVGTVLAFQCLFSWIYYTRNIIWFLGSVTEYDDKNKSKDAS
jgi:hypothetical protein